MKCVASSREPLVVAEELRFAAEAVEHDLASGNVEAATTALDEVEERLAEMRKLMRKPEARTARGSK